LGRIFAPGKSGVYVHKQADGADIVGGKLM